MIVDIFKTLIDVPVKLYKGWLKWDIDFVTRTILGSQNHEIYHSFADSHAYFYFSDKVLDIALNQSTYTSLL